MLEVKVQKKLGSVFINVEFSAPSDGITVLYGHSGAGKTSVVNMLSGLLTPDSGRISINGRVLFDSGAGVNVPVHKRRAGYIFQDKRLFPFLSVRGNLLFGAEKGYDRADFENIVSMLGIENLLDRKVTTLSGGEAQRVAIGRALLSEPEYLLMDEPMSSLDSSRKNELIPYIDKIPERVGIPVILVTHAYDELARLADYVVLLDGGVSVRQGTKNRVIHEITYVTHQGIAL